VGQRLPGVQSPRRREGCSESIKTQEVEELRLDQLGLFREWLLHPGRVLLSSALNGSDFQASGFAEGMVTCSIGKLWPEERGGKSSP
jgi:hypothetical protein